MGADRGAVGRSGRAAPAAGRDGSRPSDHPRRQLRRSAAAAQGADQIDPITRDGFAAENHTAGAFFIDIVTQPGLGPLRGQVQYGTRSASFNQLHNSADTPRPTSAFSTAARRCRASATRRRSRSRRIWTTFADAIHSAKGVLVDGGSWDSNLNSNYFGTYTINSLAAYLAGQPSNFTRRLGDPSIAYSMVNAGLYAQDDFRVRRNLTISPGLRYEMQAHMSDWKDLGPRVGFTSRS